MLHMCNFILSWKCVSFIHAALHQHKKRINILRDGVLYTENDEGWGQKYIYDVTHVLREAC